MSHVEQEEVCRDCPLRFRGESSCDADFMTIPNVDVLADQAEKTLSWIFKVKPSWATFENAYSEAYTAFGRNLPDPGTVIEKHLSKCKSVSRDPEFWKSWNQVVEYYEGRKVNDDPGKSPGNLLLKDIVSPRKREGDDLRYFYAALAVIWATAQYLGHAGLKRTLDVLVEACHHAVLANCPLEVE